jgi:DNA repair protein RadC
MQELLSIEFGVLREQYKLGDAQAAQLQATLEVARRLLLPSDEQLHQIISPGDAADLLRSEMEFLDHEEMRVLLLDTKHGVLANQLLYQGTVDSSVLRAAEIFRSAVTRKCPKVLIAHNHPTGDPEPSQEDIKITEQLVAAGSLLDVDLVDHIIIGNNRRFVSLKERLRW